MDIVLSVVLVASIAIAGYLLWANRESGNASFSGESDRSDFTADDEPEDIRQKQGKTQTKRDETSDPFDGNPLEEDPDRWTIGDVEAEPEENPASGSGEADPTEEPGRPSRPEANSDSSPSNQPKTQSSVSNPGTGNRRPESSSDGTGDLGGESSNSPSESPDTGIRGISEDDIKVEKVGNERSTPKDKPSQKEPDTPPSEPVWLVGRNKNLKDKIYSIDSFPALVGRHPESAVQLESGDVSRRHFEVKWDGQSHVVQPLDAQNATVLNEEELYPGDERPIGHEDYLQLGNALFQFHLEEPDFGEKEDTGGKQGLQFEAQTAQVSTKAMGEQIQKKLEEHDGDMDKVADLLNLDRKVVEQLVDQFGN
jgi:predicted component of type VI protein secretion system